MKLTRSLHLLVGTALLITGCSSLDVAQPTSTTAALQRPHVAITQSRFDPTAITVPIGTTVSFQNTDPFAHTVTARDGDFDSGRLEQDQTFTVQFSAPGTFAYFCEIHPTMRAEVTVE